MLTIEERGNRRILFPDGTSIISEWDKAKEILRGEIKKTKCFQSYDTDRWKEIHLEDIAIDVDTITDPVYDDHSHSPEELEELISLIYSSDRWNESYLDRASDELNYYVDSKNVRFLLKTYHLVKKLKEVTVRGVGRGSSCASLVMYLLHIHDIDPVKYKIDFSELTKVTSDE